MATLIPYFLKLFIITPRNTISSNIGATNTAIITSIYKGSFIKGVLPLNLNIDIINKLQIFPMKKTSAKYVLKSFTFNFSFVLKYSYLL